MRGIPSQNPYTVQSMRVRALETNSTLLTLAFSTAAQAKPVPLLFHAGGFCWGDGQQMRQAAAYAKPRFQPDKVDYPLCKPDLGAETRYAVAEIKRFPHRKVYAYGESAGGSIAARLAELGLVEAAAVQAPVADAHVLRTDSRGPE
jgi:hypothetical protein